MIEAIFYDILTTWMHDVLKTDYHVIVMPALYH